MTTIHEVITALNLSDASIEDGILRHYDDATRSYWRLPVADAIRGFESAVAQAEAAGSGPGSVYSLWCASTGAEEEQEEEVSDDV
jgi:hypothetical protein